MIVIVGPRRFTIGTCFAIGPLKAMLRGQDAHARAEGVSLVGPSTDSCGTS